MKNILAQHTIIRIYKLMKEKGITTSQMCKALNVDYPCFKAMLDGKQPCYGKWQKKIAEVLNVDRRELFG